MNSLIVAVLGIVVLTAGYLFYGNVIKNLWDIDEKRPTPAHTQKDGVDYIPAKHWTVLFGHHFASIAGAGPILGPVIACLYWGWAGAVLWLLVGSIFIGAVHDFSSLLISVRNKGKSIAFVCKDILGKRANIVFSVFLWLSLVLVVAVFGAVGGETLASKPQIVIPAMGTIPVAMLVGVLLYRTRLNQITSTGIGLVLLTGLIIWGRQQPVYLNMFKNPTMAWTVILFIYAFIASILPVNILLQPRDYLSTFLLFIGLFGGYIGLLLTRPEINAPAFIEFSSARQGPFWPMMFVVIACGAISGFHSVVASGTTAKQLSSEKDAKRIGFGGMITESALSILAVLAVTAGLKWSSGSAAGGIPVYPEVMKESGWIVAFSEGFGQITKPLLGGFGVLIAATILNAFIITTLDSATRITRYLTEELFKIKNMFLSTSIIIGSALYLALGNYKKIWPIFGASNQLVAALALLVISSYLLSKNKKTVYTIIPAIFMLITSGAGLIWQLNNFINDENYILIVIDVVLLGLAAYIFIITVLFYADKYKKKKNG
ncbi:MAG: carbon starvation CstA family protein [Elusimicrobiota bacterium]